MGTIRSLQTYLRISPGEVATVALLFALSLMLATGFVLSYLAGNALFLAAFGAQDLAYVYISSAALLIMIGLAFTALEARVPLRRLLLTVLGLLALSGALFYGVLIASPSAWAVFALMNWSIVVGVLGELGFWALAGRLFNLEQGKRLFGLIGAGALVARIVFYPLAALVVARIGAANLIPGALVALGFAAVLVARLAPAQHVQPPALAERDHARGILSTLLRQRYVALILALALVIEIAYVFLEFVFFQGAQQRFATPEELARFIGLFAGAAFALSFLISTLLSGVLLRRFGLLGGLALPPLIVFVCAGAMLVAALALAPASALFALIATTKFVDDVTYRALAQNAEQLLFQPLPERQRVATQSLSESVFTPLASAVTGIGLLLLEQTGATATVPLAITIMLLSAASVGLAVVVFREYVGALGRALARRVVGGGALRLDDATSIAVVERTLSDSRPGAVIYALDLLERANAALLVDRLAPLVSHDDPLVRREALVRVARLRAVNAGAAVRDAIADPDAAVRAAAAEALCALGDPPRALIAPLLSDAQPVVRDAALVGLLRYDSGTLAPFCAQLLPELAASPDPEERRRAAEIIARVGAPSQQAMLAQLIDDDAPTVRRAALLAAGEARFPQLWARLIAALATAGGAGPAASALVRAGDAVLPLVADVLVDTKTPQAVRVRLAQVCGRGGAAAIPILETQLDADEAVRDAAIRALRRCGYGAAGASLARVWRQIEYEARGIHRVNESLAALPAATSFALMRQALEAQRARLRARIFCLLSFCRDPQRIRAIELHIGSAQRNQRAYALELLETTLGAEGRALLPMLAEATSPPASAAADSVHRLRAIAAGPDGFATPWLRACALYTLVSTDAAAAAEEARRVQWDASPLVQTTAAWVLEHGRTEEFTTTAAQVRSVAMLTTIERVIILKTVGIFAATPDDVLAEVAELLAESDVPAGAAIFHKGDAGSSMYIIVEGEVRVHDGDGTLNHLGERDVFGEMALLDPEPRVASVTALRPTRLLRLDEQPFFELMDDRIEIARGVISVLTRHLRARVRDLNQARAALSTNVGNGTHDPAPD